MMTAVVRVKKNSRWNFNKIPKNVQNLSTYFIKFFLQVKYGKK